MPRQERIAHGSATAVIDHDEEGVAVVRLRGLMTRDAIVHLRAEIVRSFRPLVLLVDYSAAVLAISYAQAEELLPGAAEGEIPIALLVALPMVDLFVRQARRAAIRGVVRRVFLRRDEALRWVRRQAKLRARDRVT